MMSTSGSVWAMLERRLVTVEAGELVPAALGQQVTHDVEEFLVVVDDGHSGHGSARS